MSLMEIIIIIVAVIVVAAIAAGAWYFWQHQSLRRRFGPEYRRLAKQEGPLAAERELRGRERRHSELELRPLDDEARERYGEAWTELQTRFVDAPQDAIGAADELVTRLAAERGYPTGDDDEKLAQLSVDHARTLDHYRWAREINLRHQQGEATTEDLRQALVHYRALFADMLGEDPAAHLAGRRNQ
jgi:hypothetical protein